MIVIYKGGIKQMVFPRLTGLTYALTVLFFSEGYYYFRSLRREFENLFSSICLHPNISLKLKKKMGWDGMEPIPTEGPTPYRR